MQHHNTVSPIIALLPVLIIIVGALFFLTNSRRRGYGATGGRVVVRCRAGHLFTTLWIPGVSLKAIRLGFVRFQYCPVGEHWAFVDLVNESKLSDAERREAYSRSDSRIP